jgi:c-di-GMP-binding flagellar brake protein YcgR
MFKPRAPRYPLTFQIVYDDAEGFMTGPVVDISETGCFVETVMPLKPGMKVRMTPLVDDKSKLFEIEGEVVRKNDYDLDNHFDRTPGMGIRFINVDELTRTHLVELFSVSNLPPKA